MKNIEISLVNDFSSGSGGVCRLNFVSDEHDDVWVVSNNSNDDTQHNYTLTKEDWILLKMHVDKLFQKKQSEECKLLPLEG